MRGKLKATGIHLVISLIAALAILALLFLFWFPRPLMSLGAVQGVQLILIVDLVVGPLCTFMVYKKGKSGMFFDLSVIGIIQVGALLYGLWAIHGQKPEYMVLADDGLNLVTKYQMDSYFSKEDYTQLARLDRDSLRYAGRIPVFSISQSMGSWPRKKEKMEFEVNNEKPFYLQIGKYLELKGLTDNPFYTQDSEQYDNGLDCYLISINSVHGKEDVCLKQEKNNLVIMTEA